MLTIYSVSFLGMLLRVCLRPSTHVLIFSP